VYVETDMNLSYQEKSIWGSLIATLIIYGHYYAVGAKGSLVASVIALIVIEIVCQSVISLAHKPEPKDERDRLIAARAYRVAYTILVAGVLTILFISDWVAPTVATIFLALVVADVGKSVTRLFYYRRGV
jgi:hypothetical protein